MKKCYYCKNTEFDIVFNKYNFFRCKKCHALYESLDKIEKEKELQNKIKILIGEY